MEKQEERYTVADRQRAREPASGGSTPQIVPLRGVPSLSATMGAGQERDGVIEYPQASYRKCGFVDQGQRNDDLCGIPVKARDTASTQLPDDVRISLNHGIGNRKMLQCEPDRAAHAAESTQQDMSGWSPCPTPGSEVSFVPLEGAIGRSIEVHSGPAGR